MLKLLTAQQCFKFLCQLHQDDKNGYNVLDELVLFNLNIDQIKNCNYSVNANFYC